MHQVFWLVSWTQVWRFLEPGLSKYVLFCSCGIKKLLKQQHVLYLGQIYDNYTYHLFLAPFYPKCISEASNCRVALCSPSTEHFVDYFELSVYCAGRKASAKNVYEYKSFTEAEVAVWFWRLGIIFHSFASIQEIYWTSRANKTILARTWVRQYQPSTC